MYRIGNRAKKLLEDTLSTPRIHSVFRNAINVEYTDGYLVTILPEPFGCGPLAITLDCEDFNNLKRTIGTEGAVFDSGVITALGQYEVKSFELPDRLDYESRNHVVSQVQTCRQLLAGSGKLEGAAASVLGEESLYSSKFSTAMEIMKKSVESKDAYGFADGAYALIGLGPGLTPSGDDFLYGLLGALFYGSRYKDYDFGWVKGAAELVMQRCRHKTTIISFNMLRTTVYAEFNEHMMKMLEAVFCGTRKELEDSCSTVLSIGSSSGSDMTAGMIFGLEALI